MVLIKPYKTVCYGAYSNPSAGISRKRVENRKNTFHRASASIRTPDSKDKQGSSTSRSDVERRFLDGGPEGARRLAP